MSNFYQRFYVPQTSKTQRIDATASAQSTAFAEEITVAIATPDGMYVEFGVNPTATNASMLLTGGVHYFTVRNGYKIASLALGTNKFVNITPLAL